MYPGYYRILGISPQATDKEILSAYRKLAKLWHPDVNPNSKIAVEKFKEATEAYEVLSDLEKRRRYDAERAKVRLVLATPPTKPPYEDKKRPDPVMESTLKVIRSIVQRKSAEEVVFGLIDLGVTYASTRSQGRF